MKKILIILSGLIFLVIIIIGVMFIFRLCPPKGPWPMPPWCSAGFTKYEYEVDVSPSSLPQIKAVNMYDTWGRNYNMNMVETTQANIVESFDRVKSLGAQEIYVHDFDRALYGKGADFTSLDYQLADEIFLNDMRDESIGADDLKTLVRAAHDRGMKLGIKRNISFVNIGKYIEAGIKGNLSDAVSGDYKKFNEAHSVEWINDYFDKWQERLVEKGRLYQDAGVDIMSISPSFQEPTFAGQEKLANDRWNNLILALRQVFKGEIMMDFNVYGLIDGKNGQEDWSKYDYYKQADIVEVKIYGIPGKYQVKGDGSQEDITKAIDSLISDLNKRAGELDLKISVFYAPSSYKNGIFAGPVEFLDINNPAIRALEKDYDEQVRAFNRFFEIVKDKKNIERINAANFAWDDALDPEVRPKISVSAGFRNKPAEEVVGAWFNFLNR